METRTLTLVFHPDTLDIEIQAEEMPSDFAVSLLDRAKKLIENQEKIAIAQQLRSAASSEERTGEILRKVKLH